MVDDVEVKRNPLPIETTEPYRPTTNPTFGVVRIYDCDLDSTDCDIERTILNQASVILTSYFTIPGFGRIGDVSSISKIFIKLKLYLYFFSIKFFL